jgi:hypothetical protein
MIDQKEIIRRRILSIQTLLLRRNPNTSEIDCWNQACNIIHEELIRNGMNIEVTNEILKMKQ